MEKQFTATVYVIEENKVLLLLHPKLKKWLPPGGHLEANELPPDAAKREALEETGLAVELIQDENVWIDRWNATSFPRPWACLLENIPPHGLQDAHQHVDFIYLGKVAGGALTCDEPIRWFTLEGAMALEPDVEIFVETQQTLQKIFSCLSVEKNFNAETQRRT